MRKATLIAACVATAIGFGALPAKALQHHDIEKRGLAFSICYGEFGSGWEALGYGSYDVCVEAVYLDLLYDLPVAGGWQYWGGEYGCGTAESRIPRICP